MSFDGVIPGMAGKVLLLLLIGELILSQGSLASAPNLLDLSTVKEGDQLRLIDDEPDGMLGDWEGSVNAGLGFKVLDKSQWTPIHTNGELALMTDLRKKTWPVSLAVDLLYSRSQMYLYTGNDAYRAKTGFGDFEIPAHVLMDLRVETCELALGVRKTWLSFDTVRPFVGGGLDLAWVKGELNTEEAGRSNIGRGAGFWVAGGMNLIFNEYLNFAFESRYSRVETDMSLGPPAQIGGLHYHFILGGNW
ncbi:MAG: hypothetical protein KJ950_06130 [Proteobacteria bacterium]|nr:hypothetical protein [Pseudomonadota bacterium]MBU1688763.1 hypothetical protein [Pseudomonadota bacterium]